jgi:hypothetical protein
MNQAIKRRLLGIGVRRFGRDDLAKRLHTSPAVLDQWLDSKPPMPDSKLPVLVKMLDDLGALGDDA